MSQTRLGRLIKRLALLVLIVTYVFISRSILTDYVLAAEGDQILSSDENSYASTATQMDYNLNTHIEPKYVTISYGNKTIKGISYGETIKDAIADFGISTRRDLDVKPGLDSPLTNELTIVVNDLKKERETELVEIPYKSVTMLDDTKEIDTKTVTQIGKPGLKKVIYEYVYRNGILESKNPIREEVLTQVQDEMVAIGTMRVFRDMTIGNDKFSYWKKLEVFATSYDQHCEGCSGYTATGLILEKGLCAVDPKVIPMHTRFYVPGYGFCQAEDVGGAIKGNRIDLGFDDFQWHQGEWSARNVEIYILD